MTFGNVKSPLNVNDDDLYPEMLEPPVEREGTTEMCFVKLRTSLGHFLRHLYRPRIYDDNEKGQSYSGPDPEQYKSMIIELQAHLEENFLKNADPLNPLQFFTSMVARAILCSGRVMENIRKLSDKDCPDIQAVRDELLADSLKSTEYDNLGYMTTTMQRFHWHTRSHFQWHSLIALLSELRLRPSPTANDRDLVERGWQQVANVYTYHSDIIHIRSPLHTAVGNLTLAAWQSREQDQQRSFSIGSRDPPPPYITALQQLRLARARSVDKSNYSNSPFSMATTSTSSTSPPTNNGSSGSGIASIPDLSTFPPAQTVSADSSQSFDNMMDSGNASLSRENSLANASTLVDPMRMDASQIDWNAWDTLLQNYELPATEQVVVPPADLLAYAGSTTETKPVPQFGSRDWHW